MKKIVYSPASKADLFSIQEQIIATFGKDVATDVLKSITSYIRGLEQFPLLGVKLEEAIGENTVYRFVYIEKNYVFYRIDENEIRIIRVLHEKQDYVRHLQERQNDIYENRSTY